MVSEFRSGNELSDVQKRDLLESYNEGQRRRGRGSDQLTLEDVQTWPTKISRLESNFAAQDLTLCTYTNVHTRDLVCVWNYGLGDNDYGTLHFVLADGTAFMLAVNTDSD